ncbi:MAG: phosphatase PAP2/dual specificity phosphatase family protein [Neisseria sp.]|nr:phosphatase PAP2/dual specificity phosphatase family protein [Neisseria sp.]
MSRSDAARPGFGETGCCLLLAGVLFYSSYGLANWLAAVRAPVAEIAFAWERQIPFWAWTIVPYWSLNLFYALGFFLCESRVALRRYMAQLLTAQALAVACFILWPLQFGWAKPASDGLSGWLFASLAAFDQPYNQAPSLHIMLTLIVGRFYWLRLPRRWRPLWLGWLMLIALSVLTTYQHHFIDIPTGVLAGLLVCWLFPQQGRMPLRRSIRPQKAHGRWLAFYTLAAAGFAALACFGGAALWWLWPAAACLLLAAAYAGLGAQALQKQTDGRLSLATVGWLLPYLAVARLNMAYWLRGVPQSAAVTETLHIGSLLAARRFEAVVDVCAEYSLFRRPRYYAAVPMLDMVPPESGDLLRAAQALADLQRQGRPVLVCCALGYGRSAAVAVLWLWASGACSSLDEACATVRRARPKMVLPEAVCQRIQTAKQQWERGA